MVQPRPDVPPSTPGEAPARRPVPSSAGSNALWDAALDLLQEHPDLHAGAFDYWIGSARPVSWQSGVLLIACKTPFHREYVEDNLAGVIEDAATEATGSPVRLEVTVADAGDSPASAALPAVEVTVEPVSGDHPAPVARPRPPPPVRVARAAESDPPSWISRQSTFDRFVVAGGSRLARTACGMVSQAVSGPDPSRYNPLFLHGPTAVGKTHLMHAMRSRVLAADPSRRVVYITGEDFLNEMQDAIRSRTMPRFRQRFRNCDLFLLDNIHFLEAKKGTQQEFLHTFDCLFEQGCQIVVTSSRPPEELAWLETGLASRLEGGLVVAIDPPDREARRAIVRQAAGDEKLPLPAEVVDLITGRFGSARKLLGATYQLGMLASLWKRPVTMEMARKVLDYRPDREPPTPDAIVAAVAEAWGTRPRVLASRSRARADSLPRKVAMLLLRELTSLTLAQIGGRFGGRRHSAVSYALGTLARQTERDGELRSRIDALRTRLKGG